MASSFKSPEEIQADLGAAVKALRLSKNLTQADVAAKADLAVRALINLEAGHGSSIGTLVRALKAMDATDVITRLVPKPGISPIALLKVSQARRRARRPRRSHSAPP
jgi:transcriptional regulator with XRE-family HTH domain